MVVPRIDRLLNMVGAVNHELTLVRTETGAIKLFRKLLKGFKRVKESSDFYVVKCKTLDGRKVYVHLKLIKVNGFYVITVDFPHYKPSIEKTKSIEKQAGELAKYLKKLLKARRYSRKKK
jgi:hypothetical protein